MFEHQYLGDLTLSESFCQKAREQSVRKNQEFLNEIKEYLDDPVPPCSREKALKLLKKYSRTGFAEFFESPVTEYLPAVSCGIMKLSGVYYPHDQAIALANELVAEFSQDELAKDFLYGVAHNAPEYRTGLAAYCYIRTLPKHPFIGAQLGRNDNRERFSEHHCEVCGNRSDPGDEPKMRFFWANFNMENFYFRGAQLYAFTLNDAITILFEHKTLPRPAHSPDDYRYFLTILDFIDNQPPDSSPSKLRKALKQSGLLSMSTNHISWFLDLLGYLDILHTPDCHGVTHTHTCKVDMISSATTSDFAYPFCEWRGKYGVDLSSVLRLFGSPFEDRQ